MLKKLRHPNITQLFEVIDDPGRNKLYMLLEYVPGGVLCRSNFTNKFPEERIREVLRDILQGLTYLHAQVSTAAVPLLLSCERAHDVCWTCVCRRRGSFTVTSRQRTCWWAAMATSSCATLAWRTCMKATTMTG